MARTTGSAVRSIHGALVFAFAVGATSPAGAEPEYSVLDLGPTGVENQPWSISRDGRVAGYSNVGSHDEGFYADRTGFVFIGTPPGTSRSDLLGVNALGHAVGASGTVHEDGQAILWMDDGSAQGVTRSLGTLGGSRSAARAINDFDQVVGWSHLPGDLESRPFLWEDETMSPLPLLGGTQGTAEWINSSGQIVGGSTTDTDGLQQFAVFWDGGDPVRLPPEHPGLNNIAYCIHDNGDIAGSVRLPNEGGGFRTRAAVWRDLQLHLELGSLADGSPAEPFALSWASGINADGLVVGMSVNAASELVPFIYRDGEMVQLAELLPEGWTLAFVGSGAINDSGEIVASGIPEGGNTTRALLLTPLPTSGAPNAERTHEPVLSALPNPFQSTVLFRLSESLPPGTRIDLIDVSGRAVRSLAVSPPALVHWDGRDDRGRDVPPGVYFARASRGGETMRVLRVR